MRHLMLTALIVLMPTAVSAQLVQPADLVHDGSFTLPDQDLGGGAWCFDYAEGGMAYNPANDSLFIAGHDWTSPVGEVSIPALGGQASFIQPCVDAFPNRSQINPGDPNGTNMGGFYVHNNRLIAFPYAYYDGGGDAVANYLHRSVTLSGSGDVGPFRAGTEPVAMYAGYATPIPPAWQPVFGGNLAIGQCCLNIISRTSYGPAAFAVDADDLANGVQNAPAQPLVFYPPSNPLEPCEQDFATLFNCTATRALGVMVGDSMLFFQRLGTGDLCYGVCNGGQDSGFHAPPYEVRVVAYDLHDFASVVNGTMQPWEVQPYDVWPISIGTPVGIAHDPSTGRIFVAAGFEDGAKPRIHQFTVSGVTTTPPPPPPPDPVDADNDGVPDDGTDLCPGTPDGATVDSNGCEVAPPPPSDLEGRVSALEATVAGLQTVDNATAAQLADLQTQIDGLQAQLDALPAQTDTTALQAQLDALQARIDAFAITVSIP